MSTEWRELHHGKDAKRGRHGVRLFVLLSSILLIAINPAASQTCGEHWCNTFPIAIKATPPFGSSAWNKLIYIPDAGRFVIYTSDGIYTFSNSWWSYGVLGHVATENPWVEETTSGTVQTTVTDNGKGFLKSSIGLADRAIVLRDGEGRSFHPDPSHGGILVIDDEEIAYSPPNLSKDTVTDVNRGVRGTAAATHAAGTIVNAGAPFPQSRMNGKLVPVNDHIPDRHPFLTAAYDSRRHQLFQTGGIIEINKKTDTWYLCQTENEFCPTADVRVWKRLQTQTPVPGRADSAMTYDSDDDVMILYGGQNVGNPTSDTWLLCFNSDPQASGNSVGCAKGHTYPDWVQVPSNGSPAPRFAHNVVYDSAHHVAVMFGGINGTSTDPSDTWIYTPAIHTWRNAKPAGCNPASFRRPAMTYDSIRGRVVMYEGPLEKIGKGITGGFYFYDAGTNRWELSAIQGGPVPSSPGLERAHGRLSLAHDFKTDTFVATELGAGYALQTWELKGTAVYPTKAAPPAPDGQSNPLPTCANPEN
ncbi:MAG TPA: hypothetical protein VFE08_02405 [Candidatus Sulfotelmatobacter sp.]|nr:hypothetical protein [Candidatus Sulfotelmatobacter sp.]